MLPSRLRSRVEDTVSALCDTVVRERCRAADSTPDRAGEGVVRFVLTRQDDLQDHLRWAFPLLTLAFDAMGVFWSGTTFRRAQHSGRWRQIEAWRNTSLPPLRDFVRFYETLVVYSWYADAQH